MMWACLTEVADQVTHHGLKLTTEDWKLIFIDALKRENRIAPNLEGTGFVSLGRSTSDLSKEEMTDMIELILAFGAKHGVVFKDSLNSNPDEIPSSDDAGMSPPASEAGGDAPSELPASSNLIDEDAMSDEDNAQLVECAVKLFAITQDESLMPLKRREALAMAKETWKAALDERLHEKLKSIFVSADAVIRGNADYEAATDVFADVLGCDVAVIRGQA